MDRLRPGTSLLRRAWTSVIGLMIFRSFRKVTLGSAGSGWHAMTVRVPHPWSRQGYCSAL